MNEFRHFDAMEYSKAFEKVTTQQQTETIGNRIAVGRGQMIELSERIGRNIARNQDVRHLLAAYRGYEHGLLFLETGHLIEIVKVDDSPQPERAGHFATVDKLG